MNVQARDLNNGILQFSQVLGEMSEFLSRHGIIRPPFISAGNLEILKAMTLDEIQNLTLRTKKILQVHMDADLDKIDFDDSPALTRRALKYLNLIVTPEIFRLIRRGDIIEVYNQDHIQVFRSFNFFRICNYNLDDVLLNKWYVLYERNPVITDQMMEQILGHLSRPNAITKFDIPTHYMKERYAEPQGVFMTKLKYIATVFSGPEKRDGFLTSLRGRQLQIDPARLTFLNV